MPSKARRTLQYLRIADDLREAIRRGDYQVGEMLPSNRKLAAQMGVAQMTVKHAMTKLTEEGIVEVIPAVGTFIRAKPGETPPARRPSLQEQIDELRQRLERLESQLHQHIHLPTSTP